MNVKEVLAERKDKLARIQMENDIIEKNIESNKEKLDEIIKELKKGQEALQFVEDVANNRRGSMRQKIENVVTEALRVIYGSNYRIELKYGVKNNRSHMDIEVIKKTTKGEIVRTIGGFGGGVCDSVAVPLRLLVILGSKQTDRVCILDESYKHVDDGRIENVANFLKEISDELKMQIIIVSHHDELEEHAETIWELRDVDGEAKIKRMG